MSKKPFFTIGIASYNYLAYLPRAFSAILAQDFADYEILYCDDGSTDGSLAWIKQKIEEHPEMRIRLVAGDNLGILGNKNRILDNARGEFLLICDADDYMREGFLRSLHDALIEKQADLVIAAFDEEDAKGRVIKHHALPANPNRWLYTQHHAQAYRLEPVRKAGIRFRMLPDDVCYLQPIHALYERVAYVHEPRYVWYMHADSAGAATSNRSEWAPAPIYESICQCVGELLHPSVQEPSAKDACGKDMLAQVTLSAQDRLDLQYYLLKYYYISLMGIRATTREGILVDHARMKEALKKVMPDYEAMTPMLLNQVADTAYAKKRIRQCARIEKKGMLTTALTMLRRAPRMKRVAAIVALAAVLVALVIVGVIHISRHPEIFSQNEQSLRMILSDHVSGFYEEDFDLKLEAPAGTTLYYTLDGSMPDAQSIRYEGAIPITKDMRTGELAKELCGPKDYTTRTDISPGYDAELSGIEEPFYQVPSMPVDASCVLRVCAIDARGNLVDQMNATFFVGYQNNLAYENLAVASLTVAPEDLFDATRGIYVMGDTFIAAQEAGELGKNWWWYPGNYSNHGKEWERAAHFDFYDESHALLESKDIGIRIKGGGTRGLAQKSWNLYARKEYDGTRHFAEGLVSEGIAANRLTLFTGGDDIHGKTMDYLVQSVSEDLAIATMDMRPCALFLNGNYWGMYYLTESYDDDYIEDHYGVDRENIIMVKNGELEEGEEGDLATYQEMLRELTSMDLRQEENYARAKELLDMNSTVDYFANEIYIARYGDWPKSNYALWRSRTDDGSTYGDTKWRWMLFDVNSGALTENEAELDTLSLTRKNYALFDALMENEDFAKRLLARIGELRDTHYDAATMDAFYESFKNYEAQLTLTEQRYYGSDSDATTPNWWLNCVKNFLIKRRDWKFK